MIRVRTFFGGKLKFSAASLSFDYGKVQSGTYTEYGSAIGYDSLTTIDGASYYTINGGSVYSTNSATFNFTTTQANQAVTIYLKGETASGDYMCAGNLDSDSITKSFLKVQGTTTSSKTYTVATAGNHYIKLFFRNDGTSSSGNNKGHFRVSTWSNTINQTVSVSKTLTLEAKGDWYLSSKPSWISVSQTSGSRGTFNLTITAAVNSSTSSRTGDIVFIYKNKQYAISVSQGVATNAVSVIPNKLYVTYEGSTTSGKGQFKVNVVGNNNSWTATESSSYLSLDKTSGVDGDVVNVTVNSQSSTSSRSSNITINGSVGGSAIVTVYQEPYTCSCDCQNFNYQHTTCSPHCPNNNLCSVCHSDCNSECSRHSWSGCSCDGQSTCTGYWSCNCDSKTTCNCESYRAGCGCNSKCSSHCPSDDVCTCTNKATASCNCVSVCTSKSFNTNCQSVQACWPYDTSCSSNCFGYLGGNSSGLIMDPDYCGDYNHSGGKICDCDGFGGWCDVWEEGHNWCGPVAGDAYCTSVSIQECFPKCSSYCPAQCISNTTSCTSKVGCTCEAANACSSDNVKDCVCNSENITCNPNCSDTCGYVCSDYDEGCSCNGACPSDDGCYDSPGCYCDSNNICNSDCVSKNKNYCTSHCTSDLTCGCHSYVAVT